jgi:hypothetical protein
MNRVGFRAVSGLWSDGFPPVASPVGLVAGLESPSTPVLVVAHASSAH